MPNIIISKKEKAFLQEKVKAEFEMNGEELKCNTDRKSYEGLADVINEMEAVAVGNSASSAQLKDLFVNDKKYSFRDYFIEACYLYFSGSNRRVFFRSHTDLVKSWKEIGNPSFEKKADEALKIDSWYDTYLWYANASTADEVSVQEKMKAELIDNEEFMKTISDLADALKKGFDTEGGQKSAISLVNMKDLEKDAAGFYTHSGYQFYTDMTAWVQTNAHKNSILSDDKLPQKLFSDYAKAIVQRRNALSRPAFPEGACLSKFLGLDEASVYLPIILLAAFKADIADDESTELMACYPSYDNESTNLTHKSYSITNRTWWQDAFDDDRHKSFVWEIVTKNNTRFQIGLSRPFPSVRKNMPNERGLWLNIDLSDTPQYPRAKMVLSIQFSLNLRKASKYAILIK